MYDDVFFDEKDAPLGRKDWQTKDLYNQLFRLLIKDGQLFYLDRETNQHPLPLTGVFEIHDWDSEEKRMYELYVSVKDGRVLEVGETTSGHYGYPLPHIDAMSKDTEFDARGWEKTIAWLQKIEDERTWLQKLNLRYRHAMGEWRQAWDHLVRGVKKFFGVSLW